MAGLSWALWKGLDSSIWKGMRSWQRQEAEWEAGFVSLPPRPHPGIFPPPGWFHPIDSVQHDLKVSRASECHHHSTVKTGGGWGERMYLSSYSSFPEGGKKISHNIQKCDRSVKNSWSPLQRLWNSHHNFYISQKPFIFLRSEVDQLQEYLQFFSSSCTPTSHNVTLQFQRRLLGPWYGLVL
jgi:hypothetical protein